VVSTPSVVFDGQRYLMYFQGFPIDRPALTSLRIGLASSADGVAWSFENGDEPVLGPGKSGGFDQDGVDHPHAAGLGKNHSVHPSQIQLVNDRVLVWYGGEEAVHERVRIGLMQAVIR
jgi:hypothetical protein